MKNIILILFTFLFFTQTSDAQWIKQFSPNHDLRDIEFINRYTGWACGDNHIYKTIDGGISWNEQSHPDAYLIQQIFPVNENVVYAVGWWNFMKTTNGGENWSAFFNGSTGQGLPVLEGLHFINENTGWLVGNVVAMKTTNGGISFVDSMRVEAIAQDVYFKDSLNGIFCGYSGDFKKTTNGGKTWNRIHILSPGPLYDFYRLSVFNDSIVWLGSRPVYKSTDFGNTWDSISSYPFTVFGDYIYNIDFSSALTGYACGASLNLFKTTDGGYNWIPQQTTQFFPGLNLGMYAYNDSVVWSCGRKRIINTLTGGLASINNSNYSQPISFKLNQNYPNPFNPETTIEYYLKGKGFVSLIIYDALGNEITTLINEIKREGSYTVKWNGENYTSGIYLYKLKVDNFQETKKMLLIK
ncbi:MAG TPA: T9SS type A sorting domain-containing protein [Ignavibacteria bacterium]|nr:T9SS type A sorting domain-containing protein [Ignavibacteria bacterium]HMR42143.1 T9SS type A sorting domain-containing protein [Ignavibacteria bacterium]